MRKLFKEGRSTSILIVEDNPDHQELISVAVRKSFPHTRLFHAANGQEALQKLGLLPVKNGKNGLTPDLIIMDINLPGFSGTEVLSRIRRSPSLQHLPVIITSTSTDVQEQERLLSLGADEFVEKSEISSSIRAKIVSVLQKVAELK